MDMDIQSDMVISSPCESAHVFSAPSPEPRPGLATAAAKLTAARVEHVSGAINPMMELALDSDSSCDTNNSSDASDAAAIAEFLADIEAQVVWAMGSDEDTKGQDSDRADYTSNPNSEAVNLIDESEAVIANTQSSGGSSLDGWTFGSEMGRRRSMSYWATTVKARLQCPALKGEDDQVTGITSVSLETPFDSGKASQASREDDTDSELDHCLSMASLFRLQSSQSLGKHGDGLPQIPPFHFSPLLSSAPSALKSCFPCKNARFFIQPHGEDTILTLDRGIAKVMPWPEHRLTPRAHVWTCTETNNGLIQLINSISGNTLVYCMRSQCFTTQPTTLACGDFYVIEQAQGIYRLFVRVGDEDHAVRVQSGGRKRYLQLKNMEDGEKTASWRFVSTKKMWQRERRRRGRKNGKVQWIRRR